MLLPIQLSIVDWWDRGGPLHLFQSANTISQAAIGCGEYTGIKYPLSFGGNAPRYLDLPLDTCSSFPVIVCLLSSSWDDMIVFNPVSCLLSISIIRFHLGILYCSFLCLQIFFWYLNVPVLIHCSLFFLSHTFYFVLHVLYIYPKFQSPYRDIILSTY